MRAVGRILGIRSEHVGELTFNELGAIFPEGRNDDHFECVLDSADVRFRKVLECLLSTGFTPSTHRETPGPKNFWLKYWREYAPQDLGAADYLQVQPTKFLRCYERNDAGLVKLTPASLSGRSLLSTPRPPVVVVMKTLMDRVLGSKARGAVFRPTEVVGRAAAARLQGQFWEWTSDIYLPPLAPPCTFIDAVTGEQVSADSGRRFVLREGLEAPEILYMPPELHYRFADIQRMEPFDVALVREQFTDAYSRPLVVSNRIYRLCLELGVSSDWIPVRVDET
jgi:hypothetical protein